LKHAIGAAAAERVESGQHILLNDGSTTFHLATQLEGKGPLTVTSNSLAVITVLNGFPNIIIEIVGGTYNDTAYPLRGSLAEKMLRPWIRFRRLRVMAAIPWPVPRLSLRSKLLKKRTSRCNGPVLIRVSFCTGNAAHRTGGEQAWQHIDMGHKTAFKSITGGIFEFGFSDAILQMWGAFLYELKHSEPKSAFSGCVTPEETALSHRLFAASLESHKNKTTVAV